MRVLVTVTLPAATALLPAEASAQLGNRKVPSSQNASCSACSQDDIR